MNYEFSGDKPPTDNNPVKNQKHNKDKQKKKR